MMFQKNRLEWYVENMLVKEYMQEATHIRIFDDYCSTENTKDNEDEIKNIIISLLLNKLNSNRSKSLK